MDLPDRARRGTLTKSAGIMNAGDSDVRPDVDVTSSPTFATGNGSFAERAGSLIDLRKIAFMIRRRRRLILTTAAAALALAALAVLALPARYTGTAVVLIDPRQERVVNSEAVIGGIGADVAAVESQVELIHSPTMAARVIEKLKLADDPEYAQTSLMSRVTALLPSALVPTKSVSAVQNETALENGALVARVLKTVSVRRRGLTYIIEINATSRDRNKAALIANTLADAYLQDQVATKFDATADASQWLLERVDKLREVVRASDQAVADFKSRNNIVDVGTIGSGVTLNQRQIEEINTQLITARAKTAEAKAKLDHLRSSARDSANAASPEALGSKVLAELRVQYASVSNKEAEYRANLGRSHPALVAVRSQLASLKTRIDEELSRIVRSAGAEYQIAQDYQGSLETSLLDLEKRSQSVNTVKVRLQELEREAQANRKQYEQLLARGKETREQKELQKPDARIVSRAIPPTSPNGPGAPLLLVAALVAGLGAGLMLSLFAENADLTYRSAAALERDVRAPCLGVCPLVPRGFLMRRRARDGSLQFQRVLSSLRRDRLGKVVLVTSALPDEGKTTIATHLAATLREQGSRVLLLADGALAGPLNADSVLTAEQLLSNPPAAEGGNARPVQRARGLHVADLPVDAALEGVLAAQRGQYDRIVIDGRSILAGEHGNVLSDMADSLLLVVAWGDTRSPSIRTAMDTLGGDASKIVGAVLNKTDMKRHRLYDYDSY